MKSLHEMSERELEELLMTETKKFTSSRTDEWMSEERNKVRLRIEEIQLLLEIKTGHIINPPKRNGLTSPGR